MMKKILIVCLMAFVVSIAKSQTVVDSLQKHEADSLRNEFLQQIGKKQRKSVEEILRRNDSLESVCRNYADSIAKLKREIAAMQPFVKNSRLFSRMQYLYQLYSLMTVGGLDSLKQYLKPYGQDGDIKPQLALIDSTKKYKLLLDEADFLLDNPLKVGRLKKVRDGISQLPDVISQKQYVEFAVRDTSLSRYAGGVRRLAELMEMINNDSNVKAYRGIEGAEQDVLAEIEMIMGRDVVKNMNDRYFSRIPYLRRTFEKYKEALKEDPSKKVTDGDVVRIERMISDLVEEAKKY